MKKNLLLLSTILLSVFIFFSCSDDDDDVDYAPQLAGDYVGNYMEGLFVSSLNESAIVQATGKNKIKITFSKRSKSFDIDLRTTDDGITVVDANDSDNIEMAYEVSTKKLQLIVGEVSYDATKQAVTTE